MSCPKRKVESLIQAETTPPKKQKMDNNPTLAFCKKSNSPFFIYGLEHARGKLRDAARKQITSNDYRYNYLTIDKFNNPALLAIKSGGQKEADIYLSKIENQTFKTFAQMHLKKIKHKFSQSEKNENNENNRISFACNSAITTSREHGFKLFFVLDDINFSELNGEFKNNFTTAELRTIHEEMSKGSDLSHIQFIENNQVTAHNVVKEKLAAAFAQKPIKSLSTSSSSSSSFSLFSTTKSKRKSSGPAKSPFKIRERLNFDDDNSGGDDEQLPFLKL